MATYKLSTSATRDFIGIYKFGINRFGIQQAEKYLLSLEYFLLELSARPELARDASMFAYELKYYNYKAHVIFYLIDATNSIYIIRVLGSRMNFIEHL
jgi:toxin ParE1/3/4